MKILLAIDDSKFSEAATQAIIDRFKPEKLVERAAQRLQNGGFKSGVGVAEGHPKTTIVEKSEQWGADLIVLRSHGRSDFHRAMLGSASETVARYARCSGKIVRIRHGN
jgi:nucleotide-binding universal stress UspA family protein